MRRREFITFIGGAVAAWPLAARAQQPERVRRIGVLMSASESDLSGTGFFSTFLQGLRVLGWENGRNARIDVRWGAGDANLYRSHAAELAALAPDAVLAATTDVVVALLQASRTLPIVFVGVIDPVGSGLVASMARPRGNITGFTVFDYAISTKWLELLKEIAPPLNTGRSASGCWRGLWNRPVCGDSGCGWNRN